MNSIQDRFASAWIAAGGNIAAEKIFSLLSEVYLESHRKYHTLQHILFCLEKARELEVETPAMVLAIWFHDAVYNIMPYGKSNEQLSAEFLSVCLGKSEMKQQIVSLIMATQHKKDAILGELEQKIIDIDLSIFSEAAEDYNEYARNIREEYKDFPDNIYIPKRVSVLRGFLDQKSIYHTLGEEAEKKARQNIQAEIDSLTNKIP